MARTKDTLADRVTEILKRRFPGADVNVGRFYGAERVNGQITWDGFNDKDHFDRQQDVHAVLEEELGADVQGISIVLAYTPREIELMESE
ncbi:MAG TPA: hypothetical protein VFJ58_00520 [Armatimonadota bacterium]|nr:hypothetical protein [Armatimonadota bacterium]